MLSIIQLRQMMAEQKYFELQRLIEVQLTLENQAQYELLLLYAEVLEISQKKLPVQFAFQLVEFEIHNKNYKRANEVLTQIDENIFFNRVLKLKIEIAEKIGRVEDLFNHVSRFLVRQFERNNPIVPIWLNDVLEKYFKNDFSINLKILALVLMAHDLEKAERMLKDLISTTLEKKGSKKIERLKSIAKVLLVKENKGILEIYHNFCIFNVNGIGSKNDYKKIIEMVIYVDDFKFSVLILNLLNELGLHAIAKEYALVVKANASYSFVYIDKYFSALKKYFINIEDSKTSSNQISIPKPDLELEEEKSLSAVSEIPDLEHTEEEQAFIYLLKHQPFSSRTLCDVAVSFLQSDMPRAALKAAELAKVGASSDEEFLKASYLKINSLLVIKDYRYALDICFESLNKAQSKDDILSFLYAQAEIYIRLGQSKEAKHVLKKIIEIDSSYRLAKERLENL